MSTSHIDLERLNSLYKKEEPTELDEIEAKLLERAARKIDTDELLELHKSFRDPLDY